MKVCVSFDLPIDNIPFTDRQILRIARGKTSEPVPAATVCYVWDAKLAGRNDARQRVHAAHALHRPAVGQRPARPWVSEKRDVAADFMKLFKDESPNSVPPIIGVAIGADSDNTKSRSVVVRQRRRPRALIRRRRAAAARSP